MTGGVMTLRSLLEKAPAANLLGDLVGFAAQRRMETEVVALTGAAHGQRHAERLAQRNGYHDRAWGAATAATGSRRCPNRPARSSCAGWPRVSPRTPPISEGGRKLTTVIREAFIHGVSLWSVDDLVKALGMTGVSRSHASRLSEEIEPRIDAFLDRPIERSAHAPTAVTAERRHQGDSAPERKRRLVARHHLRRRRQRRTSRGSGHGDRPLRGARAMALTRPERAPPQARPPRPARREAVDLVRRTDCPPDSRLFLLAPRAPRGGDHLPALRHVAALPPAPGEQRAH